MADGSVTSEQQNEAGAAGEDTAEDIEAQQELAQIVPKADDDQPAQAGKNGLPDDADALRAEVEKLRRENAKSRTEAKKKAASEARTELTQQIGEALGLVQKDGPPDPDTLAQQVSASQAEAQQARAELAVYRASDAAGADPAALLDSASFLKSLSEVDSSDSDAVHAAITEAVQANPRLGADREPRMPAPNPAQGADTTPPHEPTEAERAAEYESQGDWDGSQRVKTDMLLGLRDQQ